MVVPTPRLQNSYHTTINKICCQHLPGRWTVVVVVCLSITNESEVPHRCAGMMMCSPSPPSGTVMTLTSLTTLVYFFQFSLATWSRCATKGSLCCPKVAGLGIWNRNSSGSYMTVLSRLPDYGSSKTTISVMCSPSTDASWMMSLTPVPCLLFSV